MRIGITMGDPSGIGPEIIAQAIDKFGKLADFVIIGDRWVFERSQNFLAKQLHCRRNPACNMIASREKIKNQNFTFIDLHNIGRKNFSFGKIKAEYGRASVEYLDKAMELIKRKEIACLVTCPISKEAIHLAGLKFTGHTEYFARKANVKNTVMMLLNDRLRFSLLTRHISLKRVSTEINQRSLSENISLTYQSLVKLFSIKSPRIAVCALNPHASDGGIIGREEEQIIAPAVKKLKSKIKYLVGPIAADTAISLAGKNKFDCLIAMYHDQALIPLKLSGCKSGVNITLGLPFVRTSPLHGTAFDIAGKGKADPASLISAIKLAKQCRLNQKKG